MKRRTFLSKSLGLLLAGAAVAPLAGCGFRLRGLNQPPLSVESLSLDAPISSLTDVVRHTLERAGVTLTEEAPLRVTLGPEQLVEHSLRGGDMSNEEIELRLTVPFAVQRRSDNVYLLNQQQLEATTTYQAANSDLLVRGDLHEEAVGDLRREVARQLLERLRALPPQ